MATCVLQDIVTASLKVVGQDLQGQDLLSPHLGLLGGSARGAESHSCPVVSLWGQHDKQHTALMGLD